MIQLRDYQREGLDAIWHYFANGGTGNPLLAWPCGTGKSVVPAVFIKTVMNMFPSQRFLMITHVSTLISQNFEVLKTVWPNAPASIYSAGLKLKNPAMPVVFGGIQSMIKNPAIFGFRNIIFIDEAHLVSQEESSQYLTFIATMKLINPNLRVIGLTATPFRQGQGYITDNGLFTDIVHDITTPEAFNSLFAHKYLVPLIPLRTHNELDVSSVSMNKGDFVANQLQSAVDKKDITYKILQETANASENRRSWLLFSSGIEHAEHIAETLRGFGIDCAAVHSKQPSYGRNEEYNDKAIKAWKEGTLRSVVCYGKLTTGVNNPMCDMIADLRPTLSVPLHIQKYGRGMRTFKDKKNCLVLDFSRNTPRLGCIDSPNVPKKKGEKTGDVPVKLCDSCGAYNHTRVQFCCQCGAEFQFRNKLVAKAGTDALLKSDLPELIDFSVTYPTYKKQQKEGNAPYLLIVYHCGLQAFKEFIFPEGKGPLKHKYHMWWRQRANVPPPNTVDEILTYTKELAKPKKITVWANKKYPEVMRAEF